MPNTNMVYEIKLGDKYYHQAFKLRYSVFFREHGLPENIVKDRLESVSRHFAIIENDSVSAYGRLTKIDSEVYKISQVVVREEKQKMGFGSTLLKHLINIAQKNGGSRVILNARISFLEFYQKHGFSKSGAIFQSESTQLPHQPMIYKF
jgi:predicted GNAT family N-acyltransferase